MTTARQIVANRRNARKSTGPRTPAGKAIVRKNALKHGLLSREVILPDEDEATLLELGQVQAMLGHTSPTTTAIYAHAIQRAERNPALAIPVEV